MSTLIEEVGEWSLTRYAGRETNDPNTSRIRYQLNHHRSGQVVTDLTKEELVDLKRLINSLRISSEM